MERKYKVEILGGGYEVIKFYTLSALSYRDAIERVLAEHPEFESNDIEVSLW